MRHEKFDVEGAAETTISQREHERVGLTLICQVRQGMVDWRVARLEDISTHGFRIAWFPTCSPHSKLWVRIPGLEQMSAVIRWKAKSAVGCEFTNPLHVSVMEHIAKQASP